MPGLANATPSSLFGEGSNYTAAQEQAMQAAQQSTNPGTSIVFGAGDNTAPGTDPNLVGKLYGNNMQSNEVSASTPSVSSGIYGNAINLANAQANNYAQAGNAALGVAGPQINNANQAAMRAQLQGTNNQYGALVHSLSQTAAGEGPNAGQAQFAGNQTNAINAAMAGAGARGGSLQGQMQGFAGNQGAAAQQAAATRGGQITAAQQGLAGAYNGQGQMNLSTYGNENNLALQQADLNLQQQGQNQQQAMSLYGASEAEQEQAQDDFYKYNQGAIGTLNATNANQNTQNNQTLSQLGFYGGLGASFATGGASLAGGINGGKAPT